MVQTSDVCVFLFCAIMSESFFTHSVSNSHRPGRAGASSSSADVGITLEVLVGDALKSA